MFRIKRLFRFGNSRFILRDHLLIENKLSLQCHFAERCPFCGSYTVLAIKELRMLVIPNGCEESLINL